MSIFLYKNNQQTGPFSESALRDSMGRGEISATDLIWKEGMTEWQPLSSIFSNPPPLPAAPPLPASAKEDAFAGKGFLLAKIDKSGSKNHYDVINIESGKVILHIREAELSGGGKLARSGLLDGWGGGQGLSKFHVALSDPSGAVYLALKGGGMGGHSDACKLSGEKIGEIKRTSMFNLHFEAFAEEGVLFKVISRGIGKLTSEQKLLDKEGNQFGKVSDSGWGEAKKILGDKIRLIDSDSMLRSKYSYKHRIEIDKELSTKEKCFLFGAIYQLAHVSGE